MIMKKSKKLLAVLSILLTTFAVNAQQTSDDVQSKAKKEKIYNEKGELIKQGWNFGPLPVVGYNSDLGFQYGACVDIFNYGDGSRYPKFDYKMNLEVSAYTKGSLNLRFYGDFYNLLPNSRLFVDAGYFTDKRFEFYGFNGYASPLYDDIYVLSQQSTTNREQPMSNNQDQLFEYFDPDFKSVFYRIRDIARGNESVAVFIDERKLEDLYDNESFGKERSKFIRGDRLGDLFCLE